MTTNEMVKTLAAHLKITQQEARRLLQHFFTTISAKLQNGETMVFRSFGALGIEESRPIRTFDPATREFVPQPSEFEFFFRPYKRLKEIIKAQRLE